MLGSGEGLWGGGEGFRREGRIGVGTVRLRLGADGAGGEEGREELTDGRRGSKRRVPPIMLCMLCSVRRLLKQCGVVD